MENIDIARAWKDEEYRNSLSEEQKAQLPDNPAGQFELTDEDLNDVAGGCRSHGAICTVTAECGCRRTAWWCRR
jgi:mersacidin/lichenicidin family type 2 lantibiotic